METSPSSSSTLALRDRSSSSGASAKPARRDAARCFFECLVLNSKGYINLEQTEAFGDLTITPRELAGEA